MNEQTRERIISLFTLFFIGCITYYTYTSFYESIITSKSDFFTYFLPTFLLSTNFIVSLKWKRLAGFGYVGISSLLLFLFPVEVSLLFFSTFLGIGGAYLYSTRTTISTYPTVSRGKYLYKTT